MILRSYEKQAGAELGQAQVKLEVLVYFGVNDDVEFVVEDEIYPGWWLWKYENFENFEKYEKYEEYEKYENF